MNGKLLVAAFWITLPRYFHCSRTVSGFEFCCLGYVLLVVAVCCVLIPLFSVRSHVRVLLTITGVTGFRVLQGFFHQKVDPSNRDYADNRLRVPGSWEYDIASGAVPCNSLHEIRTEIVRKVQNSEP